MRSFVRSSISGPGPAIIFKLVACRRFNRCIETAELCMLLVAAVGVMIHALATRKDSKKNNDRNVKDMFLAGMCCWDNDL